MKLPPKVAKITVIIPSWNTEKYIGRAIESVLKNSGEDFEIVVVDKNSTDQTQVIANSYPKVRLLKGADNGLYDAVDRGIREGQGEIVGWLGSDDQYFPTTLQAVSKAFQNNPQAHWVVGDGDFLYPNGGERHHRLPGRVNLSKILGGNPLISPSVFFKKSFYTDLGGFQKEYQLAADYDLWVRMAQLEAPHIIREPLSIFAYTGHNLSTTRKVAMYRETQNIIRQHFSPTHIGPICLNYARLSALIIADHLGLR